MIAAVAGLLVNRFPTLQPWTDEAHIAEQLLRWGAELAIYIIDPRNKTTC
jgi:hypothetical protein